MADGLSEKRGDIPIQPLGHALVSAGLIDLDQLSRALDAAALWDVPLGQAVLALGFARPLDLYRTLADHLQLPFVDVLKTPPSPDMFDPEALDFYIAAEAIPVAREGTHTVLATPDPLAAARFIARRRALGQTLPVDDVTFAVTARLDVLWTLQARFAATIQDHARNALNEKDPVNSARGGLNQPQILGLAALVPLFGTALAFYPLVTAAVVNLIFGLFFAAVLGLRAASIPMGLAAGATRRHITPLPDDASLPFYTIIVPLFNEVDVLPLLAEGLRALDYPAIR